jgi:glycine cleavage system H protein
MTILILLALVLAALVVDYFIQIKQTSVQTVTHAKPASINDYMLPEGVFAASSHVWSILMPSGRLKMGIDPLITRALGKIDQVFLPEKGKAIQAGQALLEVVQGDKRIRIASPVSGVVEEVNPLVAENANTVKKNVQTAWTVSVKPHSLSSAMSSMKLGEEARQWLSNEMQRLRDFLAGRSMNPELAMVMQDGGTPAEGVLESMDKETWQQFEAEFLKLNN